MTMYVLYDKTTMEMCMMLLVDAVEKWFDSRVSMYDCMTMYVLYHKTTKEMCMMLLVVTVEK